MERRLSIGVTALGLIALASGAFAQAPAARGATPAGQGEGRGRGAAAPAPVPPALMFKEEWKFPPYTGQLNDENRRVTQESLTNARLELKLYGTDAKQIGVYDHEQRHDLWSGMTTSPSAFTLRDKANYIDMTGLARLRAIIRTNANHTLYPVVKLADGTLAAGSRGMNTEGDFLSIEFALAGQRWYKLDPARVVTGVEVKNPDLTKVDEIGFVDLAPGGGHGNAGWFNVSTVEVYAKPVPRTAGSN